MSKVTLALWKKLLLDEFGYAVWYSKRFANRKDR